MQEYINKNNNQNSMTVFRTAYCTLLYLHVCASQTFKWSLNSKGEDLTSSRDTATITKTINGNKETEVELLDHYLTFKETAQKRTRARIAQLIQRLATGWTARRLYFKSQWGQDFSALHVVQIGFGACPASCTMATADSFPGGKAAGAWNWPLTSN
jgi:hypothetical protein